jgi:prepilin-type N-terminal cleavage/methylation domain-containing protein
MNSTLPHLQPNAKTIYLAPIRSDSPSSLRLGICRSRARQIPRGFTLVEIAIAVFIITLLLGSILVPLTTQVEQRQVSETQKMLEDIKDALIGHAVAYGRLPCPDRITAGGGGPNDTANDGVEDHTGTACFSLTQTGNVPWVTLGLGATDPWGNRFRYRVDPDFAHRTILFNFATSADLCVGSTASSCMSPYTAPGRLTVGTPGPDGAVAVIISHGKNGYGAINTQTGVQNPCPPGGCSADEVDNSAGGTGYPSRSMTSVGAPAGEFDDIVIWISKFTLFNRMVAAGKLP